MINQWTPESVKDLEYEQVLESLKIVVDNYVHVLKQYTQEELKTVRFEEWSIQDILSHLAEWNKLTIENILLLLDGGTITQWIEDPKIDEYNDRAVESRRELSFYAVALEFFKTSSALLRLYKNLTPEQRMLRFRESDPFIIEDSVRVDLLHFNEHYIQLLERVKKLREDF